MRVPPLPGPSWALLNYVLHSILYTSELEISSQYLEYVKINIIEKLFRISSTTIQMQIFSKHEQSALSQPNFEL